MKATNQLKEEHESIKLMLRIMKKIYDNPGDMNKVHLEKIIDFIRTFADACHHGKEEGVLFPEMEKAGMSREFGPIAVMLHEHTEGREYIKEWNDALQRYKNGDNTASAIIRDNMENYINLLSDHIEKENNILFMMADNVLNEQKQEQIFAEFEKIENEKIGNGKLEEYHKLLEELSAKYEV